MTKDEFLRQQIQVAGRHAWPDVGVKQGERVREYASGGRHYLDLARGFDGDHETAITSSTRTATSSTVPVASMLSTTLCF